MNTIKYIHLDLLQEDLITGSVSFEFVLAIVQMLRPAERDEFLGLLHRQVRHLLNDSDLSDLVRTRLLELANDITDEEIDSSS